jgi:S-adenosylmethionine-diacylglycerol 3-amino-3-carboxypropyl transferase
LNAKAMSDSIAHRASFEHVRYANCWEDPELLLRGLNIQPGAHCLSIASAGDNSLALLLADPAQFVAFDLSIPQLSCLELRIAAIRKLDHAELLAFLGVAASKDRLRVYDLIRSDLPGYAREFWDHRRESIEQGIIHNGKFERYFDLFRRRVLPLVHSASMRDELIKPKSREKRALFYEKRWNSLRWRLMFRLFFSRAVLGRAGRDPEFFRYVEGSVADRILARTKYGLTELDPSCNPYIEYIMSGNFRHSLPLYLEPHNLDVIRGRLDRITIVHGDTDAALARVNAPVSAFNLSDIFEYMSKPLFEQTVERLLQRASSHARFAYWNLLLPRTISASFPSSVQHLTELSQALHKQDRAFFYSAFHVEEVIV